MLGWFAGFGLALNTFHAFRTQFVFVSPFYASLLMLAITARGCSVGFNLRFGWRLTCVVTAIFSSFFASFVLCVSVYTFFVGLLCPLIFVWLYLLNSHMFA